MAYSAPRLSSVAAYGRLLPLYATALSTPSTSSCDPWLAIHAIDPNHPHTQPWRLGEHRTDIGSSVDRYTHSITTPRLVRRPAFPCSTRGHCNPLRRRPRMRMGDGDAQCIGCIFAGQTGKFE
jgi:hypothetical protein